MEHSNLFDLEPHGPDTFVGIGPRYPWGGLFGGQIVAQALRAAAATVDGEQQVHSLRAYFIRRGDHTEPIRFEVDRIRNGRSFSTRRVVARQAIGAILNLEASFHSAEDTADVQTVPMDLAVPGPDDLPSDAWSDAFDRRSVPRSALSNDARTGTGRSAAWMRVIADLTATPTSEQLLHRCWLAYMSDDMPADTVRAAHPEFHDSEGHGITYTASLDHTIWFHRPFRADEWHLYDFSCHGFTGARGLGIGHVFTAEGVHVATVAQEVLMRDARQRQD
ncbi:MAG: acyl-CoA thioesterase domain-containing protein [Ilumatobacteraceae bacterium]